MPQFASSDGYLVYARRNLREPVAARIHGGVSITTAANAMRAAISLDHLWPTVEPKNS